MPSETTKPDLVAKYIEKVRRLTSRPGIYAYRGQEDAIWLVESAASRRIRSTLDTKPNNPPDMETFIRYHEDNLLAPARMDGYGIRDGRVLSDLELLAELQHFGAATCLIDFTTNFLAALWFACYEFETYEGENKEKKHGKVFVLNIDDVCRSIGQFYLENEIRPIMGMKMIESPEKPSYWYWAPHGMNSRVLKQDSLFVFGKSRIASNHFRSISIEKDEKADLLNELRDLGVSRRSLFKDLPGFASMSGARDPISTLKASAHELFFAGISASRQGDMERAIRFYDDAASEGYPRKAELFLFRGNANAAIPKYDSAIEDYTKATAFSENDFRIYLNRGIVKFETGDYDGAVNDFTVSQKKNRYSATILFRRALAYERLQEIEKMRADLEEALESADPDEEGDLIQKIQEQLSKYGESGEDVPS